MGTVSSSHTRKRVEIKRHEILSSKSSQYLVEKVLGEGCFGKVAQCTKVDTKEKMALKILGSDESGTIELLMLQELRRLDPDKVNLVKLTEHFHYSGYVCLAFEMLDVTLYDYMREMKFRPMHLFEIQMITQQLLVALNALKSIGMVHADIKPDNIMFINRQRHSVMVKLIDFGMARPLWLLQGGPGRMIQPLPFRAPEVILGLELDEAVDMWSLGCVLAFMCLGQSLYPGCEYKVIKETVEIQGQIDDHLLDSGLYTNSFFRKDEDSPTPSWKMNTHQEYIDATKGTPHKCTESNEPTPSLEDMLEFSPDLMGNIQERKDTMALLCLLKHMLKVDPEKRIKASDALENHFITKLQWKDINPTLYVSPDCLTKLLGQLNESTGKFKPWVGENNEAGTSDEPSGTDGLNEASTSVPENRTQSDRSAADNNNRPDSSVPSKSLPASRDVGTCTDDLLSADGGTSDVSLCYRQKDSSVPFKSFSAFRDVGTCTDDLLSADDNSAAGTNDEASAIAGLKETSPSAPNSRTQSTADNNDRPPEETDLDETITAGTDVQSPDTNKAASPVSDSQKAETTGFVQVKTKKNRLKRIRKFFTGQQVNKSFSEKTGSQGTTAAGTEEKPLDMDKADSYNPAAHNSNTDSEAATTGFVQVKTKKTHLKRIRKSFSRIFKPAS